MHIEIWSDFVCPFCYLGKTRFEKALEQFEHKDDVTITYRSFQLDPQATSHPGVDIHTLIANKYGISIEQAKASNDAIVFQASEVGLNYQFDSLKPNNTRLAHEIAKFAKDKGLESLVVNRLLQGYFEEGADIGDLATLLTLVKEVGIDEGELQNALNNGLYTKEVEKDQQEAHKLGITGVPFFVINNQYGISGAQKITYFTQVLNKIDGESK